MSPRFPAAASNTLLVITPAQLAKRIGVAQGTARKILERLQGAAILERVQGPKTLVYWARGIVDALYERPGAAL